MTDAEVEEFVRSAEEIYATRLRVILEPKRRRWSREFLEIAGAAEDFPYPPELPEAEPVPEFDE